MLLCVGAGTCVLEILAFTDKSVPGKIDYLSKKKKLKNHTINYTIPTFCLCYSH